MNTPTTIRDFISSHAPTAKIFGILCVLTFLCWAYISSTSGSLETMAARADRIVDNDLKRTSLVYEIAAELNKAALAQHELLFHAPEQDGYEALVKSASDGLKRARDNVDFLVQHVRVLERKTMIAEIDTHLAAYEKASASLLDLLKESKQAEASRLASVEMRSTRDSITRLTSAMIESYRADIEENREKMLRESGALQIGHLLLAVFSIPIACAILWAGIR